MPKKTKAQLMEELKKLVKSSRKISQEYIKLLGVKAKRDELEFIVSSNKMYIEIAKENLQELKKGNKSL